MEAVPRLPMIKFELKHCTEATSFNNLKAYIGEYYQEDPETYSKEVHELEQLRNAACRPSVDVNGCNIIKRYYCQLHSLQCRFPLTNDRSLFTFSWRDVYSRGVTQATDIRYEMAVTLYNYGVLHTMLGASDERTTADGMKLACTHFQCAAWAFGHLRETFPQATTGDLAPELLIFMQELCYAQAQECILEKSLADNRKSGIVAKVTAQIVCYYNAAYTALLNSGEDGSVSDIIGTKNFKELQRYVKFKIAYLGCVLLLYQGQQSEENQKMGERVTLYQAAWDKLEEAQKECKGMNHIDQINEALTFVADVVEAKRKAAKNENEFIYHEEVPDIGTFTAVQGANLVKGLGFNVTDIEAMGEDIFHRLVPMKAHEASSMYSEEKATLIRKIGTKIEDRDAELNKFMQSLNVELLNFEHQSTRLPQGLVDRCAAINAKPNAIPDLVASMSNLAEICTDVESMLTEIKELLQEEERLEQNYQKTMGHRPSVHFAELHREFAKYQEAHNKAGESNDTLRKAMGLHVNNLKILAQPLNDVQRTVPVCNDPEDNDSVRQLNALLAKVNEMRMQRAQFFNNLRAAVTSDDITAQVIAWGDKKLEKLFKKELGKHEKIILLIEQNLSAQGNILRALTDCYAQCAPYIKSLMDTKHKREHFFSSLASSYDVYDDLLSKSSKGLEFYKKLQGNIQKLLSRIRGARDVQDEERQQRLQSSSAKVITAPTSGIKLSNPPAGTTNTGPKLKDYLKAGMTISAGGSDANMPTYIPTIRPSPLGSETTTTSTCTTSINSNTSSSSSKYYPQNNYNVQPNEPPPPYSPYQQSYGNYMQSADQQNYPTDNTYIAPPIYQPGVQPPPYTPAPPVQQSVDQPQSNYTATSQMQPQYDHSRSYSPASSNYQYDPNVVAAAAYGYQQQPTGYVSYQSSNQQEMSGYQPMPQQYQTTLPASSIEQQQYQSPASVSVADQMTSSWNQQNAATNLTQQMANMALQQQNQQQFTGYQQPQLTNTYQQDIPQTVPTTQTYNQTYTNIDAANNQTIGYEQQTQQPSNQSASYGSTHPGYYYNQQTGDYQYGSGYQVDANNGSLPLATGQYTNVNFNPISNTTESTKVGLNGQTYANQYDVQPVEQPATSMNVMPTVGSIDGNSMYSTNSGSYYNLPYYGYQNYPVNAGQNSVDIANNVQTVVDSCTSSLSLTSISSSSSSTYMQSKCDTNTNTSSSYDLQQQQYDSFQNPSANQMDQQNIQQYQQYQQSYGNQPFQQQYQQADLETIQQQQHFQQPQQQTQPQQPQQQPVIQTTQPIAAQPAVTKSIVKSSPSNVDLLSGLDFAPSDLAMSAPLLQPKSAAELSSAPPILPIIPTAAAATVLLPTVSASVSTPEVTEDKISDLNLPLKHIPSVLDDRKSSIDNLSICSDLSSIDQNFDWESASMKNEDFANIMPSGSSDILTTTQQRCDPFDDPKVVKWFHKEVERMEKIMETLNIKTLNGTTHLDNKWKEIQDLLVKDESKRTTNVAKLFPEKNRTPDSIPYDHARVLLPTTTDDYINAVHVRELSAGCPQFILAQTPLINTVKDFWCMIWSQKTKVVVCLHSATEMLDPFFPQELNKETNYGDFFVTVQKQFDLSHCTERTVKVAMHGVDATLNISIVQIKIWQKSLPSNILGIAHNVITTYKQQKSTEPSNVGPVLINCVSGSERSGVLALAIACILATKSRRPLLINAVDVWYRICSQRKGALRDISTLELSMQIVLNNAHELLNKRGIMTSYQMKNAQSAIIAEKEEINDPFSDLDPLWQLKQNKK